MEKEQWLLARTFKVLWPFSGCMHDSQNTNIFVGYLVNENVWKIIHYHLTCTKNTT